MSKENKFTYEKLGNAVHKMNNIIDKFETTYDDLKEKGAVYLKNYLDWVKTQDSDLIYKSLFLFLDLKTSFYEKYGNEIIEKLWPIYDESKFSLKINEIKNEFPSFFICLFFLDNPIYKDINEKGIIEVNKEEKKFQKNEEKLKNDKNILKDSNSIIDILIFKVYTISKIQIFYTTMTGLLLSLNNSVVKFYKVLSMFALCLWQMPEKYKFIGSILYVMGGVLRDFGRSYLKTKGIYNENLSYHHCHEGKKHHDTHFFEAKTLLESECDLLKYNLLPAINNFLFNIIEVDNTHNDSPWDDFIVNFDKLNEKGLTEDEKEEIIQKVPFNVQVYHIIMLFLSDFVFFFISNFCENNKLNLKSDFEGFDDFIKFSEEYFIKSSRNIFEIWNYGFNHQRFLDVICEKTEYDMGTNFNMYGISFIFILLLKNKKLPLILNINEFKKLYKDMILLILKNENNKDEKNIKNYEKICLDVVELLKEKYIFEKSDEMKDEFINAKIEKEVLDKYF